MGLPSNSIKSSGTRITDRHEIDHHRASADADMESLVVHSLRTATPNMRNLTLAQAKLGQFCIQASFADAIVLDTETTENLDDAQIIEIGAILIRNDRPFAEYEQLIHPHGGLQLSSTLLSGITEDDLLDQPDAEFIIPGFLEAIRSLNVIGHNVAFDIDMLAREAQRFRCPPPDVTRTDTLKLARKMFPNAPSLTLQELLYLLDIDEVEDHRALSDARQTWVCWQRLNSMNEPVLLTDDQREESTERSRKEEQRKNRLFTRSAFLEKINTEPVNERPSDVEVRTLVCGVNVTLLGAESQNNLKPYGYDACFWVYVVKGRIPKGKYEGYPTYLVFLDDEKIGYINKHQMERHCGQVPDNGASMIARIPNSKEDRDRGRLSLHLYMPAEHEPADLSSEVIRSEKPKNVKRSKSHARQSGKTLNTNPEFLNSKPHKRTLKGGGEWATIDSAPGLSNTLSEFPDGSHVWVVVRRNGTVKLGSTLLGTYKRLSAIDDCNGDGLVTAAVIEHAGGAATVRIEMPRDGKQ